MCNKDLSLYLQAQLNAMDKSKYIESEKIKKDLFFDDCGYPSQEFYIEWIQKHGQPFSEAWGNSLCKDCSRIRLCKECLRDRCEGYSPCKAEVK